MKKNIRNIIIIGVLLAIAAIYSYGNWGKSIYIQDASSGDNRLTNELTGNVELSQSFSCPYDGFNAVKIKLLRVGAEEVKGYTWRVDDQKGETIASGDISEKELQDRTFQKKKTLMLDVPEQKNSKGEQYTLYLMGEEVSKEGCLQAYVTQGNKYATAFAIDGNEKDQALVLKVFTHRFNVETFIVFLGLVLYVGLFFKFMYKLFR